MKVGAGFIPVILVLLTDVIVSSITELALGDSCQVSVQGSRPLAGICTSFDDCPYAKSNYNSEIDPTLCAYPRRGIVIVCCPTEERISGKKCQEYKQSLMRPNIPILPFFPGGFRLPPRLPVVENTGCTANLIPLIVNGRTAQIGEFPYMAAIGYSEFWNQNWLCGGTLISEDFVMTAAHCATKQRPPRRVLLGDIYLVNPDMKEKPLIVPVTQYYVHPDYKQPYNDIALLRLATKVTFSYNVRPACLPQPEQRLDIVNEFVASGWGWTEYAGPGSNILQAVDLGRANTTVCNKAYEKAFKAPGKEWFTEIRLSQLCAGAPNKDTCRGDSGGPLAVKARCLNTVVGITSFGSRYCGIGTTPGVYTNVQSYLDWIEGIVWPQD